MKSRFDYVKYDNLASAIQNGFKNQVSSIEAMVEFNLKSPKAKEYALKHLEEFYMWVGKAIRDDQIERNGSAELQEERKDG